MLYVIGSYFGLAILLALVSMGTLAALKSHEISIRNIASLSVGGFIGLVVGFYIWGYAVETGIVLYSRSSSVFWPSIIISPIVGAYISLKLFGSQNDFVKKRKEE
jgi:hypothetical protein